MLTYLSCLKLSKDSWPMPARNTEFRLLRCYLKQNEIPPPLSQKVTQFLQHEYSLRQEARSADMEVPVLALLSKQLQGELQLARYNHAPWIKIVQDLLHRRDLCFSVFSLPLPWSSVRVTKNWESWMSRGVARDVQY